MKNAAILFGALLLSSASIPSMAQSGMNSDEGRPHTSNAPSRELVRMCKAEAKDKQLSGKERSKFMRDCQTNQVPPASSGSSSASSMKSGASATTDAEGRPSTTSGNTSRISKKPPTADNPARSPSATDAEGRAKTSK